MYCGKGHWVDLPPRACVGKEATSRALKESGEQKFCISDEWSQLLVFKQYRALGKFRCKPEVHGLAKDCCYCHMSDPLKITLIQELNVFSWQWWSICVKEEIFQRRKINLVLCYNCFIDILQKAWVQQVLRGFQLQWGSRCTERGGCEPPLKGLLFRRGFWRLTIFLDTLNMIT